MNQEIYNLINSTDISNYCKEQNYKFNTLEIAILIYRNKTLSIKEKIQKYKDLLENYEDMPFVGIHVDTTSSTKELIQAEIKRLETLENAIKIREAGYFYTATTFYQDTGRIEENNINYIKDTFEKTYNEVLKDINGEEEIKATKDLLGITDKIVEFEITKKQIDSKHQITAKYNIINKKPVLNNIYDSENLNPDMGEIYIYIPTPFKKGDLLYSRTNRPFDRGFIPKKENVFVLDELQAWRYKMPEKARTGKCGDSSDMMGYGYFINNNDIFNEVCWEYDSWEYFEGKLEGMQRILKAVSELIKGNIDIELLIATYNKIKLEEIQNNMCTNLNWFTKEGLEKAGFTDEDIEKLKGGEV